MNWTLLRIVVAGSQSLKDAMCGYAYPHSPQPSPPKAESYCVHTSRLGYQNSARSPSIPLEKGDFRSGSLLCKEG
jgi:hypothetical protein